LTLHCSGQAASRRQTKTKTTQSAEISENAEKNRSDGPRVTRLRRLGFRSAAGRRRGAKKNGDIQVAATKENAPTRVGAQFSMEVSVS